MKQGDYVTTVGPILKSEEDEKGKMYIPDWLPEGKHRISITRKTSYGVLVKTDRHPFWINSKWYVLLAQ